MFVNERQALARIGRAARTLADWRAEGLPYCIQPERGRLYRTTDLDERGRLMAQRSRVGKGRPKGSRNRSTRGR